VGFILKIPRPWGFETEIRAERQADGIKKTKQKGVKFGKKRSLNETAYHTYFDCFLF